MKKKSVNQLLINSLIFLFILISCKNEQKVSFNLSEDKKSIDILTDIQLIEARVSSLNQWKKDSSTSLLYFQLRKKYNVSQSEIDTLVKKSLLDPSESILIYEKVKKNIEKMNDTLKLN